MARPGEAHTSEDIWHLSIEDFLASPNESAQTAGPGPFVINLSTSGARIGAPPKGLPRFDKLHFYQLKRLHEGQSQYRLRLGIIETELFAPTYKTYGLATVRYPVLEITATVEPFENRNGYSLRVHRAGKPRRKPTADHSVPA